MTSNWLYKVATAVLAVAFGISTTLAADAPVSKVAPRTIRDITALLDQYKPDPAKVLDVRRILDQVPPDTQDRKDLARFYKQKALAADEVGAASDFVIAMRKVVELGGESDLAEDIAILANAEEMAGNLQKAIQARKLVLVSMPARGYNVKKMVASGYLAKLYARFGDLDGSRREIEAAEQYFQKFFQEQKNTAYNSHNAAFYWDLLKADVATRLGKHSEAEALLRHAAVEYHGVLTDQQGARSHRDGSSIRSDGYMNWLGLNNQVELAKSISAQGRLTEAEILARNCFIDGIKAFGRYSYYTGRLAGSYVRILLQQGRYAEAEQLARAAIDIFRQVGTPEDSTYIYDMRSELGVALVAQRRYTQALDEFTAMGVAFRSMPSLQVQLERGNAYWALALIETGNPVVALAMLDRLLESSRRWLGPEHPDTAILQALHALALARLKQPEAALNEFRSVQNVLIAEAQLQSEEASPLQAQSLTLLLEAYLHLLGEVHGTPIEQSAKIDAANEAFRITDLLRGQSTQQAVVASATRVAVNDLQFGKEIRKQQDLQLEGAALFRIMRDLMTAPQEQQLPKVMADMQQRIESIRQEQKQLNVDLGKRFPAYANLIRPQPPSLAEARAVLRPGEALLNLFVAPGATFVWAMKKEGVVAFSVVPIDRDTVGGMVSKLRSALDPGDVDIDRSLPRFDLDVGFELYSKLLTPVAAGWMDATSLLVVANGAMSQLPLAVLPTAKSALAGRQGMPYSEYGNVPWLIRQTAVTQLPSVNALVVLRKLPLGSADRDPFVGFGDPLFAKDPLPASRKRKLRNTIITRSATNPNATDNLDWMRYSAIPPLPDTREEILSLATTLKADITKDVFLGAEASKDNLKRLDLSKRQVVAFATHGLLPNEFPGVNEPSLALAYQQDGTHGLLTLEDILSLKLDADWVVLSACNTAAGDGRGADAVSGLGRGFFYAGTRALLVTHWPVESVSARLLVTGVFERQAIDPSLSRAQALRQSMLSLMQRNSGSFAYAHPLFWAPYSLVGDGGG